MEHEEYNINEATRTMENIEEWVSGDKKLNPISKRRIKNIREVGVLTNVFSMFMKIYPMNKIGMTETGIAFNVGYLKYFNPKDFQAVFTAKINGMGDYVLKLQPLGSPSSIHEDEVYKKMDGAFRDLKFLLKSRNISRLAFPRHLYAGPVKVGGVYFNGILLKELVESLEEREDKRLTPKQIYDLLTTIDYLHEEGYAHGDIKPSNIMFDENNEIFLINYTGLQADEYSSSNDLAFAGVNVHDGIEDNKMFDDLESILYLVLYSLTGTLPWIDVESSDMMRELKIIFMESYKEYLESLGINLTDDIISFFDYFKMAQDDEISEEELINHTLKLFNPRLMKKSKSSK